MTDSRKIIYFLIPLVFLFAIVPLDVNADSEGKAEITLLKKQIIQIKDKISFIQNDIAQQKITVTQNEKEYNSLKEKLRDAKRTSDDSWNDIQKIIKAKDDLAESESKIKPSKDKLILLLNQKSDNLKLVDTVQQEINDIVIQLRKQVTSQETISPNKNNFNSTGYVKNIGITLSSSCVTMIKNNYTTTCPSYEELYSLDSSNQDISGAFGYKDGVFQRLEPATQNSWRWYALDNTIRLFVDPPSQMQSRIKMIEMMPNFDTYAVKGKAYQHQEYNDKDIQITNHFNKTSTITVKIETQKQGRILYHDRYVDDYCKTTMINSDNWKTILPDTIHHMRSNCADGTTTINNMEFIIPNNTEFNREESPSWQELRWFEEAEAKCKTLCFLQ